MKETTVRSPSRGVATALVAVMILSGSVPAWGASHREAPITALDHKADITDFYAFRSYDANAPNSVTLILDVDPLLEPSNAPNWFPFDPEILYAIRIDNDNDAVEDVVFEVRFKTEIRAPAVFQALVGAGAGIPVPQNQPNPPLPPGTILVPPAITALDGPGSEGFNLRQKYTVTMKRRIGGTLQTIFTRSTGTDGRPLIAVPTNAGPRTMPSYPALAEQGIYDLGDGVKVFAGTVDDPFWIDLGAVFDTANLRPSAFGTGVAAVLSDAQDADDTKNFASDDVAGFNVNAIAIQVPISLLTRTGRVEAASSTAATIGTWGTTARPRTKIQPNVPGGTPTLSSNFAQIQRMGNALINELLIGTGFKDRWSMSVPGSDGQFAAMLLDPLLARVLNAATAGAVAVPDAPRNDLLPLVMYLPPIAAPGTPAGPVADLLRLNTGVAPTALASQRRLGLLDGDGSGYPNGRRVVDDVTDISLRVVAGVLNPAFNVFPNNRLGDGVNTNDVLPYRATFPYLNYAHSGRNSRHVDPQEPGCVEPSSFAPVICPVD